MSRGSLQHALLCHRSSSASRILLSEPADLRVRQPDEQLSLFEKHFMFPTQKSTSRQGLTKNREEENCSKKAGAHLPNAGNSRGNETGLRFGNFLMGSHLSKKTPTPTINKEKNKWQKRHLLRGRGCRSCRSCRLHDDLPLQPGLPCHTHTVR